MIDFASLVEQFLVQEGHSYHCIILFAVLGDRSYYILAAEIREGCLVELLLLELFGVSYDNSYDDS